MEMNEEQKALIVSELYKAIEKVTNTDKFMEECSLGFFWGKNTTHYMAEAAANVLICAIEAEEEAEENK